MTQNDAPPDAPLTSDLAGDDPELDALIREFVAGLAGQMAALEAAFARSDLGAVAHIAHRPTGAAAGYGFAPITEAAAAVEARVKLAQGGAAVDPEEPRRKVAELAGLCRRAAGPPAPRPGA